MVAAVTEGVVESTPEGTFQMGGLLKENPDFLSADIHEKIQGSGAPGPVQGALPETPTPTPSLQSSQEGFPAVAQTSDMLPEPGSFSLPEKEARWGPD